MKCHFGKCYNLQIQVWQTFLMSSGVLYTYILYIYKKHWTHWLALRKNQVRLSPTEPVPNKKLNLTHDMSHFHLLLWKTLYVTLCMFMCIGTLYTPCGWLWPSSFLCCNVTAYISYYHCKHCILKYLFRGWKPLFLGALGHHLHTACFWAHDSCNKWMLVITQLSNSFGGEKLNALWCKSICTVLL